MSRHSRGAEPTVSRRSRRRGEEPSITEWLDSGSYGPYAAEANRGGAEESVGTEPSYETLPPPGTEPTASYGADSSGTSYDTGPPGSYGAAAYETGPPGSGAGPYGASAYDTGPPGHGTVPSEPSYNGSYGLASYATGSEPSPDDGSASSGSAYSGSYGESFSRAVSADESPSTWSPSYGTATESSAGSYSDSSYGGAPADGYGAAVESSPSYSGSYGASFSHAVPADESSSEWSPSHGTAVEPSSSYGTAVESPASYGSSYQTAAEAHAAPPADESSYYNGSYGTTIDPSRYHSTDGPSAYGTAPAGDAPSYNGSFDASRYGAASAEAPAFTEDASTYGTHASYAVSTPDSPANDSYLAPPAYEPPAYEPPAYDPPAYDPPAYDRPGEAYRSIPAVADPNRPAPGEYGFRSSPPADPPMADYLTREHIQDAPAPVRRPTTPIPSAARSRKAPKEPPAPPVNRAGRLRMRVNPVACDGHGLCAELLPEIVSLDDWGYPMPVVSEVPAELEVHAQRAAQQCPTLAIILERRQPRAT